MAANWQDCLPENAGKEEFFEQFNKQAQELTVKVLRTSSANRVPGILVKEMKEKGIKKAAASPLTLIDNKSVKKHAESRGINFSFDLNRDLIEKAEIGISEFNLGIAESGTIVQDASVLHTRLVSMLPPVHAALVSTGSIVETFPDALEVIQKVYKGIMPPFLSFITGPSKTADIERVLTIGVHGPEELIILFVDK